LHFVDETTVLAVIDEFLTEFDSLALYFRPGLDAASQTLGAHLRDGVGRLLAGPEDTQTPVDPWDKIKALDPTALAPLLADETAEVCAITLAKLPAGQSAELLELLGSEKARGVTLAATRAGAVSFGTVQSIGVALADAASITGETGPLVGDPADRVSQILNFASGDVREDLLESLDAADAEMAAKIRRSMFTFGDIPDRVEVKDVPKLVRAVENDVLVAALAGGGASQKDAVEYILANLSKRLSEQLVEEIREIGEVKPKDADKAMSALIQGIRGLETSGDIVLIQPDE
jgi:flagellar motor switch protein FliG